MRRVLVDAAVNFDAMATARDGKRVALDVDAKTGAITPEEKNEKNEHK